MATQRNRAARTSLETLVQDRARLGDLLAILGVPALLVGVFLLPMPVRRTLAFDVRDPTLLTAFTGDFVHFQLAHLLSNLVGYGLLVPVTYALSALVERRWQFRVVFVSLLLGLPFALSLVDWLVLTRGITLGFSGVLLGFYGYLPIVLYQYVTRYAEGSASLRYVPLAFFVGIVSIATVFASHVLFSLLVASGALLLALGYLYDVTAHTSIRGLGLLERVGIAELGLASGLLYLLYPLAAFPFQMTMTGRILNVLTHFVGFALSFISIYCTAMLARRLEFVEAFRTESDNI